MTLICLDKTHTTVRNYVNGHVFFHVTRLYFGTVGGKIDININIERLLSFILAHYILKKS